MASYSCTHVQLKLYCMSSKVEEHLFFWGGGIFYACICIEKQRCITALACDSEFNYCTFEDVCICNTILTGNTINRSKPYQDRVRSMALVCMAMTDVH